MRRLITLLIMITGAILLSRPELSGNAQENVIPDDHALYQPAPLTRSDRLGITFISSAQIDPDEERYQNAVLLGAGWTRWPLYWNAVETAPGQFDWSDYDRLIINDVRYELHIDAILLDRPTFYQDGNIISGLYEPIFADGSDIAGQGKEINSTNPWASFVYQAVQRYKRGGVLARQQGWINEGIDVWEIWNEPDLRQFWEGSIRDYARLLKVAYLAAHQADPTARVMFGGLLFNTPDNWLARVLAIYENDSQAANNNYFMDAVALHSYTYPWRTGWLTLFVRDTLRAYGLQKPIFVNETGISVWDDYPGPFWTTSSSQRLNLATADQQAWFFIQSAAYAWSEGADVVFYHQLYDDCGDQAPGTDFPFHYGELCTAGQTCSGDAFGLFRNPADALCYSHHPHPGTPRPSAAAFRMMAQVFSTGSFESGEDTRIDDLTIIAFERPASGERILVIWNRRFEPNQAVIPAASISALLYTMQGVSTISPQEDNYVIPLNAALPDNYPDLEPGDISAIGGEPVILVESLTEGGAPPIQATSIVQVDPLATLPAPVAGIIPTAGPVIAPTTAPEDDNRPPVTYVDPLPEISARTFIVSWGAEDNGQVDRFVVWVQINDDDWQPWLETRRTEAIYTGQPGNVYRFAVWAVDTAGNWSTNVELQAQAETRVQ